jgi:hypothetical protein
MLTIYFSSIVPTAKIKYSNIADVEDLFLLNIVNGENAI